MASGIRVTLVRTSRRTRMRPALAAALVLLALAAPARAAPADVFHRLMAEHYAWLLGESPPYATPPGAPASARQIGDLPPAASAPRAREAGAFLPRLEAIPETA